MSAPVAWPRFFNNYSGNNTFIVHYSCLICILNIRLWQNTEPGTQRCSLYRHMHLRLRIWWPIINMWHHPPIQSRVCTLTASIPYFCYVVSRRPHTLAANIGSIDVTSSGCFCNILHRGFCGLWVNLPITEAVLCLPFVNSVLSHQCVHHIHYKEHFSGANKESN